MTHVEAQVSDAVSGPQLADQELVRRIQSLPPGDPDRTAACEELLARHASIVRSCVHRYRGSPEPAEDLMQVGYLGLLKAFANYDPALGDSLAAYARPCVSGEIKRHFRDRRWQVRVQRSVQELRLQIREAAAGLTQQLSRAPTAAEIAASLGVTESDIRQTQQASQAFQADSLDAPLAGEDRGTIADLLGCEDPSLDQATDMQAVWTHLEELPEREQRLLMMRYYGNLTQAEAGHELGISQMHASRLERRALAYLRQHMTEDTPEPDPAGDERAEA